MCIGDRWASDSFNTEGMVWRERERAWCTNGWMILLCRFCLRREGMGGSVLLANGRVYISCGTCENSLEWCFFLWVVFFVIYL